MDTLQELYDSEINFEISCFWDGGFDLKLGDEMNGYVATGHERQMVDAVEWLKETAIHHYPDSTFAKKQRRN